MSTALHFNDGNGLSLSFVKAGDLSEIIYKRTGLWPPGFALAISPFIKLGISPLRASIVVDIFSTIILLGSFLLIFRLLKTKVHYSISIIFFIFYGLSLQPFNFQYTSGSAALSFFVLAVYLFIKNLNAPNDFSSWFTLGIASFLPSFFHFSYYPLSFALSFLFLTYTAFIDPSKRRLGISNFAVFLILLAAQLFYQASLPTGINYLIQYHPNAGGQPYWENLKMFIDLPTYLLTDGFPFKRFVEGFNFTLYAAIRIMSWAIFFWLMFKVKKELFIKYKAEKWDFLKRSDMQFAIICLLLSWLLIAFLIFLSLYYPPEVASWMPNNVWTYVVEARYFAPVIILLPLAIVIVLWKQIQKPFSKAALFFILLSGFIFSASVNLYYLYKYGTGTPEENYARYYHHRNDFEYFLEENLQKNDGRLLIYSPGYDDDYYALYAILKQIPILRLEELEKQLYASKPVKVLMNYNESLDTEEKKVMKNLIHHYGLAPVMEFDDSTVKIYELHLP